MKHASTFMSGKHLQRCHFFPIVFFTVLGYVQKRKPSGNAAKDKASSLAYAWKLFNKMYNYCTSTRTLEAFTVNFTNSTLSEWMQPHPYDNSSWSGLKCELMTGSTAHDENHNMAFIYVVNHAHDICQDPAHPKVSVRTLTKVFTLCDRFSHVIKVRFRKQSLLFIFAFLLYIFVNQPLPSKLTLLQRSHFFPKFKIQRSYFIINLYSYYPIKLKLMMSKLA